ncbi:hypothetical protein M758_4G263900 [Ceratodon purpureus]|nr:hypothetical protein M758_4G263900 [Ceratodon purpureus]
MHVTNDPRTQPLATTFASNRNAFFDTFGMSMQRMGRQGLLSGPNDVRKQCWKDFEGTEPNGVVAAGEEEHMEWTNVHKQDLRTILLVPEILKIPLV